MKKIGMTICGVAFISVMSFAQRVDSTSTQNESRGANEIGTQDQNLNQNRNLNQATDPQSIQGTQQNSIQGTPRTQDQTSPTVQPLPQQQSQPQLQSQPTLQPQPELQSQPTQVPTQIQPAPNSPVQQNNSLPQNQLNQPVQPTPAPAPTPTDPAGSGTKPRR